ncbi:GGDEF domain-containing protein [Ectothiorhodospira lacustris]|uniref:GGDEF domain-containing protein n=1 Tax=Ectothiorhodospira lacustris TaxID=2899127 RepID=UPI001EE784FC|nr:sensor domain-containing diguanylate cyclase [Ectothiorhodospira lacustris]MCG5509185.1 diguanylate cyclase [Ectothiorhodospira lacustris]MCG5520975.1 diguanylate cyclase [Ectothiorhodospira lacustris]
MNPPVLDPTLQPELARALHSYVMESGRLVVVEVDSDGRIRDANVTFRSRFAGFADVRGESLSRFLASGDEIPDIEPGLAHRTAIARIFNTVMGGENYLFHAYPLNAHTLLIGEPAKTEDSDVIGRMGSLALEMSRLVRDLRKANHDLAMANELNQQLARTDALTHLANRRYFMERLQQGVVQAQSRQHALSILMMDLDHFKQINDSFGHSTGDAVLAAFAELLRALVRISDLPGRLGGEEFGLYMFDAHRHVAAAVAERIRASTWELRPSGLDHRLGVSIGIAMLEPEEDAEALMRRADAALYQAKNQGRNRIVIAGPGAEQAAGREENASGKE